MRRTTIIASAVCFLASALGCMSFSFGEHTEVVAPDGNLTKQTGTIHVPPGQEVMVYYPGPYASPPNLVVDDTFHQCSVIEQRPDGFRVKNSSPFAQDVTWSARGMRAATVTVSPAAPGVSAVSAVSATP